MEARRAAIVSHSEVFSFIPRSPDPIQEVTGESYDFSRHQQILEGLGVNRSRLVKAMVKVG